jgi:SAM-dependent methyltransferase
MSFPYSFFRGVFRILPVAVQNSTLIQSGRRFLVSLVAEHDDIYNQNYFRREVEDSALQAAPLIADAIIQDLRPQSVIDVGCGTGAVLKELNGHGCSCVGLDEADYAVRASRAKGLEIRRFNIEKERWNESLGTFDVALSMEVAEHLPERCSNNYLDLLTHLAPTIVFTAAPPGQGGSDHVNEQPYDYWIGGFETRNYSLDNDVSSRWRRRWSDAGIAACYHRNIMVFRRAGSTMQASNRVS